MTERGQPHQEGYILLRQAIPQQWLDDLRRVFEAGVQPPERWPVPRNSNWRYAQLDEHRQIQAVCRLPEILASSGMLLGERFFLAQVEGRDPVAGGGHQRLHRDGSGVRAGDTVSALIYLDDFGPDNGATRIVPGSHRPQAGEPPFDFDDESQAIQLAGRAGDALVFDAELVHAASRNISGAKRRTLMVSYQAEALYALHVETRVLRNVRMATCDRFEPSGKALGQLASS
ncbi:phytanoyl-CoA dioxygenase family protein [Pseudomonas promysalinigenes]|uniref:phytanoyl-CoA dioxygenase family protein n=1 Tax=Pseudomonas promysalinigenes TaxID=485898 RepID=UPI0037CC1621